MFIKIVFLIFLVFSLNFEVSSAGFQVLCNSTLPIKWDNGKFYKTCYINQVVFLPGYSIWWPKDNKMTGLKFQPNKKTKYLPENLNEIYLNLEVYQADNCTIQEISKINFAELRRLEILSLEYNQIEKIPGDTFEDLFSLKYLSLSKITTTVTTNYSLIKLLK